jgi:hypothetical protein
MFHDEARNFRRIVAFLLINGVEEIEGISEYVPASARRIEQPDFLGLGDFDKIRLRLSINVVSHFLTQPGVRAVEQPEATE